MPPALRARIAAPEFYDYARVLAARSSAETKGQRTAQQIRIAACTLLQTEAVPDLTVAAICKAAGVANGTFYLYFPDQTRLLNDLLLGFARFLQAGMIRASHAAPDQSIRAATRAYGQLFERNRGLMKCLVHHLDEFAPAREVFHRLNRDWIDTVVASTQRRLVREGRGEAISEAELRRRAHALGGMTDQYFSSLYLSREPGLIEVSHDHEAVIDTLSTIWERGLQP
jgi:AcrR family transcriptional regulator